MGVVWEEVGRGRTWRCGGGQRGGSGSGNGNGNGNGGGGGRRRESELEGRLYAVSPKEGGSWKLEAGNRGGARGNWLPEGGKVPTGNWQPEAAILLSDAVTWTLDSCQGRKERENLERHCARLMAREVPVPLIATWHSFSIICFSAGLLFSLMNPKAIICPLSSRTTSVDIGIGHCKQTPSSSDPDTVQECPVPYLFFLFPLQGIHQAHRNHCPIDARW